MAARESQDLPRRIADLDGNDAYALLGLAQDAGSDEIAAAYRREMARAHPDRGGTARQAQLVNCAFDVLTRHRESYDELLDEHLRSEGPDVLFVDPDVEPLEDPGPAPARRLPPLRVLATFAVLVAVIVAGLLLKDGDRDAGTVDESSGWTASEARTVPEGQEPTTAPPPPSTQPSAPPSAPVVAPTQIASTVVVASGSAAVAGGGHRCEVRGDGTLWCAGGNARGQLGIGSTRTAAAPVRVGPETARWVVAAVGGQSTCALQTGGELWCWGDNSHGQLGDGTNSARTAPVRVEPSGSRWLALDLDTHTCAVRTDHTLWCWGAGKRGELGDGGTADRATPVQIGSERIWAAVSVGAGWTCAVRQDGSRQCWGTAKA